MTNDEKYQYWIDEVEREIAVLKSEQKDLKKRIIENRQAQARARNTLKSLKDDRRRASERDPRSAAAAGAR